MRYLIVALLLCAGCTPTFKFETCPMPDPAVAEWQRQITARVNDHDRRLDALDNKETPHE